VAVRLFGFGEVAEWSKATRLPIDAVGVISLLGGVYKFGEVAEWSIGDPAADRCGGGD
jgi:hypothetical protein